MHMGCIVLSSQFYQASNSIKEKYGITEHWYQI